jgi:hypothetical protein
MFPTGSVPDVTKILQTTTEHIAFSFFPWNKFEELEIVNQSSVFFSFVLDIKYFLNKACLQ